MVGVVLVLINLPLAHYLWTDYRLDTAGVRTEVEVVVAEEVGSEPRYLVTWRFTEEVRDGGGEVISEVTRGAFLEAQRTDRLLVEYLPGDPSTHRAVGEPGNGRAPWVVTLLGNGVFGVILLLMLWGRRQVRMRLEATADLVRCKPPESISELPDGEIVVRGEVLRIEDGLVVLRCQGKEVTVLLGAFENPIGYQQFAEARGRRPLD